MTDYQRIKDSFDTADTSYEEYREQLPRWLNQRGLIEHTLEVYVLELFAINKLLFDEYGRYLGALTGEEIEAFVPRGEDSYYTESTSKLPQQPTQEEISQLASAMSIPLDSWRQQ